MITYAERERLEKIVKSAVRLLLGKVNSASYHLILDEKSKYPVHVVIGGVNEVQQLASRNVK